MPTGMPKFEVQIVDTDAAVKRLLNSLRGLPSNPPSLYLDLEGINLSRHGSISFLQLYVPRHSTIYLIDVFKLGNPAFTTPGTWGTTLRSLLQDPKISKCFFDCRNDSDALYAQFNVALQGVVDIQLMEVAAREVDKETNRDPNRDHIRSLDTLIQSKHIGLEKHQKLAQCWIQGHGKHLWCPEEGGNLGVFNYRPITSGIVNYCLQGVMFLPQLWEEYHPKLTFWWAQNLRIETLARVSESQSEAFATSGPFKNLSPWASEATKKKKISEGPKKEKEKKEDKFPVMRPWRPEP